MYINIVHCIYSLHNNAIIATYSLLDIYTEQVLFSGVHYGTGQVSLSLSRARARARALFSVVRYGTGL